MLSGSDVDFWKDWVSKRSRQKLLTVWSSYLLLTPEPHIMGHQDKEALQDGSVDKVFSPSLKTRVQLLIPTCWKERIDSCNLFSDLHKCALACVPLERITKCNEII